MKKRKYSFLILLIIILLSATYFTVSNYMDTKRFVLESVERETDELLSNFTAEVNRFSMERISDIQLMGDHLPYLMANDEDVTLFLALQTENMPYFTGLGFITPDGEIQAADGTHFPVQQKESFERALTGEIMFSDVFTLNQDATQKVTAISAPVVNHDGDIIGVISGVVNLSNLISELVEESNLPGIVFLLKDQEVLFTSDDQNSFQNAIPNSDKLLQDMKGNPKGSWNDFENKLRFIKYEHTWNDWVVIVDSKSNPAAEKITKTLWLTIFLIISTIIILLAIYIFFLRIQKREELHNKLDLLTGLGTRALLEDNIIKKLAQDPSANITLFFIKLDRFSEITERMGYQVTDQILFNVGNKLKKLQGKLNVYRVGTEEFVLTAELNSIAVQSQYAHSLVKILEQPIEFYPERSIWVTASIGVRAHSNKEDTTILLMQDAMFACLEASKNGGNQFVYFTEKHATESEQQRQLATNLAQALENDEFRLVYQPIYSISEDRIVSFEALMRWDSPTLGEIGPFYFIPLLEESDAIVEVGRWLMKEVAEQVIRWEQEGYHHFAVTLNVSTKQLQYAEFLSDVKKVLTETQVDPQKLVFEVTESIVAQNLDVATDILKSLNELGIKTALDDFGTGYSSLSILKTLPFQYMKVDRAFIMEVLSDDGQSEAMLKSLIEIANSLHLTTITEGVETLEQLRILQKLGAHRIQGYYFSKPIRPEEAVLFLKKENLLESMIEES